MLTFFLVSASSKWKPKTNLNKSFKKVYCPLRIIQPTLLAISVALAFLPVEGNELALRNVGSLNTRFRYAVRSVACAGNEPKEPVGRDLTKFWRAGGSDLLGAAVVGVVREKPTFIAAFKMRIFRRVRFTSSGAAVVVTVLVDLALPWE